ncbi:MAG: 2-oxoacid:acceptor oxidoreductase family protein, partial [Candidatus Omnitrophica bacterium]|nr:2-oxoacid:acceptor oxidoreductase family protein [Candidatus Omnitrophota bacterium]
MTEYSVLIGGKAGFGIDKSGSIIGRILNGLNYHVYIYRDYPSIIRGGHTFSIIRACRDKAASHRDKVDFILALNQDTVDLHKGKLKDGTIIIYDSSSVKVEGSLAAVKTAGVPIGSIIKEENANDIMRNACIIGAFCKSAGLDWDVLDRIFRKEIAREIDANLKVAKRGYDAAGELIKIEPLAQAALPMLSGNQAIGLGLIKGGLDAYIAYPMTPSSPILHFLAEVSDDFSLKVIHPESEISVILMALGFSYMGQKAAVGTSGGGFCLMTEGLSFAGMAELPVVIIVGQRPGPSTGLPTYSAQTELHFVLNAGQGEFPRFVAAPGDAEEAYFWSAVAMNIAWKYQMPSFILSDKNLGEGIFNFDIESIDEIKEGAPVLWDGKTPYKRYLDAEDGVSPLTFAPAKDAVIKVNSYEHDEYGITTEDPAVTTLMQDKRLRKERCLSEELQKYKTVNTFGNSDSSTALVCWGSNKGVSVEAAQELGLKA